LLPSSAYSWPWPEPFLAGYYSGRNDSLAKLGLNLSFWGAVLGIFAAVAYKKQKANPASPR